MALRILPFRQYSDHDVVNLYALANASVNTATTDSGAGDAGVFVKISDGNFDNDPITYQTNAYLGETASYPFLGTTEMYPEVNLKVTPATSGDVPLGMTLYQTAKNDENGEKLLYNPVKKDELQAVLSGQAVPLATRGIFTLTSDAIDNAGGNIATHPTPGQACIISPETAGKVSGIAFTTLYGPTLTSTTGHAHVAGGGTVVKYTADHVIGTWIGTGTRRTVGPITDVAAGTYGVLKLNL